jgi:hypothetical protein
MGINIRQKGQEGEREVARAMNSIVEAVLTAKGFAIPEKPIIQRNQNQSAVGGHDLSNPFKLGIEVKRQEQISVNTWWTQCTKSCVATSDTPVLVYRKNKAKWAVVLLVDMPLGDGAHMSKVRAEVDWDSFLRWFYIFVSRCIDNGVWTPTY